MVGSGTGDVCSRSTICNSNVISGSDVWSWLNSSAIGSTVCRGGGR